MDNYLKLFITLFIILSSNLCADTKIRVITQQIESCPKNVLGQTILSIANTESDETIQVSDPSFVVINSSVVVNKTLENNTFTFNLTLDSDTVIQISGSFVRSCDSPSGSTSTVIIAFLASLCLILLTALALTLIILRRKKPITFKFGQKEDNEYDRQQYNDNFDDNSSSKSSSLDVTNNVVNNPKISLNNSPRPLQPRKSSLKPPKNSITDQLNNNSSYENGAFNSTELEVVNEAVDEVNEDKPTELKINFDETRRKSIVTFSDQTEVNYG